MKQIEIIETPIFTEDIDKLLGPDEYRALQLELLETPTKGKLIRETRGARKLRFAIPVKEKVVALESFIITKLMKEYTCFLLTKKQNKKT